MQECKNKPLVQPYTPPCHFLAFLHSCTSDNTHNVSYFSTATPKSPYCLVHPAGLLVSEYEQVTDSGN